MLIHVPSPISGSVLALCLKQEPENALKLEPEKALFVVVVVVVVVVMCDLCWFTDRCAYPCTKLYKWQRLGILCEKPDPEEAFKLELGNAYCLMLCFYVIAYRCFLSFDAPRRCFALAAWFLGAKKP